MWVISQDETLIKINSLEIKKYRYRHVICTSYNFYHLSCSVCENNKNGYCIEFNKIIIEKEKENCCNDDKDSDYCDGILFKPLSYFEGGGYTRIASYNNKRAKEIFNEIVGNIGKDIVYKFPNK
jgi:hypothetical protein